MPEISGVGFNVTVAVGAIVIVDVGSAVFVEVGMTFVSVGRAVSVGAGVGAPCS